MPNERNSVKTFAVGLLAGAILLSAAGPASAATLRGSTKDSDGQDAGRITLKTKVKKFPETGSVVVQNVYSIKLSGVPVTCDDGGQLSTERMSNTIRARIAVRRWRGSRYRYRFSASGLESTRSNGATFKISGWINRRGTIVSRGFLSGEGITAGEGVTCSLDTSYSASTRR